MTDVNSSEFQSASSRFSADENNSSLMLNQSNVPMDIDLDDEEEIIASNTTKLNGYRSSTNENDKHIEEDVFHQGKPILNKSFDILPQVKDDDPTSDNNVKTSDVLDRTVELPNSNDELDLMINDRPAMLSNEYSLEYPYEIPQPVQNRPSSSPPPPTNPVETATALTKNLKLNANKTYEGQEPSATDKSFDTNTFVLKKKDRRKVTTPSAENSFNPVGLVQTSEVAPSDLSNKQSPFNTPLTSLDTAAASRSVTSQQQPFTDPTRIIECVEQYYRILYQVCECTEELKQELRQVKSERDQMSEDLINAENAYTDVKKRNEKLKLIINEHKTNTDTLKRFSEESVRYTEEQKQKYAVLKQHAQEKLNEANSEIERLKRTQGTEMDGVQTQLRYAQLRVQSLEQEIKSIKQELDQKKKENNELTNICDELLATNKR